MRPDGEPAAVGEALRSPVLIRYQPRYREGDAPRGPTGPARARGRGDRIRPFAAAHESECDAVDGSSPGTRVPSKWVPLEAPTVRRSYLCRRLQRLVSISPSRFSRCMELKRLGKWSSAVS